MAGIIAVAQTAEIALTGTTIRTVVRLKAPTNQRLKVLGWGVFFDGTSPSAEPVQVRLLRQSSDGTSSALTPVPIDQGVAETLQATGAHSFTSTEPTEGNVMDCAEVHPQSGYEVMFPPGREIIVTGAGRIAIDCLAPANVNVRAKIIYEE